MTLEQMRYFVTAAHYLSFSKAANALFIHQTTISRAVSSIEEELGSPLFMRLKYSLQLTPLGHAMFQEATDILQRYDNMANRLKTQAGCIVGEFTLLAPPTYVPFLSQPYAALTQDKPRVTVHVEACPYTKMNVLYESVLDRSIDAVICFSFGLPPHESNLCTHRLMRERMGLVVPLTNPLSQRSSIALSDIHDTTFLWSSYMGKSIMDKIYEQLNTPPRNNRFINTSGETLLLQFSSGIGLTFMPREIARSDNFVSIPIEDLTLDFDVLFVWHRNTQNPALLSFIDYMKKLPPIDID